MSHASSSGKTDIATALERTRIFAHSSHVIVVPYTRKIPLKGLIFFLSIRHTYFRNSTLKLVVAIHMSKIRASAILLLLNVRS
jgi:hypothetical protein